MPNFGEISSQISEVGGKYARAKSRYDMLAESKKSVLAKNASTYEGSEATRMRLALCSDVYKEYLLGVMQAQQEQLELRYQLIALETEFKYFQSMNSLKKSEMNLQ